MGKLLDRMLSIVTTICGRQSCVMLTQHLNLSLAEMRSHQCLKVQVAMVQYTNAEAFMRFRLGWKIIFGMIGSTEQNRILIHSSPLFSREAFGRIFAIDLFSN